jgi:hypothetical protein
MCFDHFDGIGAGCRLRDHLNSGMFLTQVNQSRPRQRLIINNHYPHG